MSTYISVYLMDKNDYSVLRKKSDLLKDIRRNTGEPHYLISKHVFDKLEYELPKLDEWFMGIESEFISYIYDEMNKEGLYDQNILAELQPILTNGSTLPIIKEHIELRDNLFEKEEKPLYLIDHIGKYYGKNDTTIEDFEKILSVNLDLGLDLLFEITPDYMKTLNDSEYYIGLNKEINFRKQQIEDVNNLITVVMLG